MSCHARRKEQLRNDGVNDPIFDPLLLGIFVEYFFFWIKVYFRSIFIYELYRTIYFPKCGRTRKIINTNLTVNHAVNYKT